MKMITNDRLQLLHGGSNRQCLIDGALTVVAMGVGVALGGFWGAAGALLGGMYAGNSNGCFE